MKKVLSVLLVAMLVLGMGVFGVLGDTTPMSRIALLYPEDDSVAILAIYSDSPATKQDVSAGGMIPFGTVLYAVIPKGGSCVSSDEGVLKRVGTNGGVQTPTMVLDVRAQFLTISMGNVLITTIDANGVASSVAFTVGAPSSTKKIVQGQILSSPGHGYTHHKASDRSKFAYRDLTIPLFSDQPVQYQMKGLELGIFCTITSGGWGVLPSPEDLDSATVYEVVPATGFEKLRIQIVNIFDTIATTLLLYTRWQ
ncbi:MAG: hypothetical protein LBN05_03980 [Oscillospiraceae bacterium]|jgi:hypothetical protein|nr:hypothetical protein [Oscillospiraceae bacterium]